MLHKVYNILMVILGVGAVVSLYFHYDGLGLILILIFAAMGFFKWGYRWDKPEY